MKKTIIIALVALFAVGCTVTGGSIDDSKHSSRLEK